MGQGPFSADSRREVARILLQIKAVGARPEDPFTLTSGTKSPVYIDCRRLISFVNERERVIELMEGLVNERGSNPAAVAGGETAGIPYAAFLSYRMKLPMLYVRKQPKGFGRNAQVEGYMPEGSRVVLVEDLIFDGGSKVNFVLGLRNAGFVVEDVFTVASYGLTRDYEDSLGKIGVKVHWLTDWNAIVDEAETQGYFDKATCAVIREFLSDVHAWSRQRGGK